MRLHTRGKVQHLINGVSGNAHRRYTSEKEATDAFNDALIKGRVRVVNSSAFKRTVHFSTSSEPLFCSEAVSDISTVPNTPSSCIVNLPSSAVHEEVAQRQTACKSCFPGSLGLERESEDGEVYEHVDHAE